MAGLDEHYSARDIEQRILAGIRAAGLNPTSASPPSIWGRSTTEQL
jgi:hypothetical protein